MENVVVDIREGHILSVRSFCFIALQRKLLNASGLSLSVMSAMEVDSCTEFNLWISCRPEHTLGKV